MQHFDRCLLKLGRGDLPIAELPDSIRIPPENLCKLHDDSGIAIRESLRRFMEKIFPDINANVHAPSNSGSLDIRNGIPNTNECLSCFD